MWRSPLHRQEGPRGPCKGAWHGPPPTQSGPPALDASLPSVWATPDAGSSSPWGRTDGLGHSPRVLGLGAGRSVVILISRLCRPEACQHGILDRRWLALGGAPGRGQLTQHPDSQPQGLAERSALHPAFSPSTHSSRPCCAEESKALGGPPRLRCSGKSRDEEHPGARLSLSAGLWRPMRGPGSGDSASSGQGSTTDPGMSQLNPIFLCGLAAGTQARDVGAGKCGPSVHTQAPPPMSPAAVPCSHPLLRPTAGLLPHPPSPGGRTTATPLLQGWKGPGARGGGMGAEGPTEILQMHRRVHDAPWRCAVGHPWEWG